MSDTKYPFWYGGAAGLSACTITHPLDLAKVRLQTAPLPKPSTLHMILSILRKNGVTALYSGLTAAWLRQCTYSLMRFGIYEHLKELIPKDKRTSMAYLLPISMVSGAVGGIAGNPADIINIRMQNDSDLPKAGRRYRNAIDGVFKIYKNEGFKHLFKGLETNLVRGVLMTSSQVVSYDVAKTFLIKDFNFGEKAHSTVFISSLFSGLIATTICSPADVLKTIIMNSTKDEPFSKLIKSSLQREGISFLFRGWVPSFIRLGPNTILIFLFLEQLRKHRIGM